MVILLLLTAAFYIAGVIRMYRTSARVSIRWHSVAYFALGWISQQISIFAAFAFLALIYTVGTLSAFHARTLLRAQLT